MVDGLFVFGGVRVLLFPMGGFRGYVNPGQDDEAPCDGDGREMFVEEQPWGEHRNERHKVNEIIDRDRADFPNDFAPNQKAERRCNDAKEDQVEIGTWLPEAWKVVTEIAERENREHGDDSVKEDFTGDVDPVVAIADFFDEGGVERPGERCGNGKEIAYRMKL